MMGDPWQVCEKCGVRWRIDHECSAAIPCPPDYTLPEDDTSITRKHFLDPDPYDSTSCKVCGRADGWGVLHLPETPEFDVDDDFGKAPRCDRCPHFLHRSACDVVVSRWPTRVCPCGGVAA